MYDNISKQSFSFQNWKTEEVFIKKKKKDYCIRAAVHQFPAAPEGGCCLLKLKTTSRSTAVQDQF